MTRWRSSSSVSSRQLSCWWHRGPAASSAAGPHLCPRALLPCEVEIIGAKLAPCAATEGLKLLLAQRLELEAFLVIERAPLYDELHRCVGLDAGDLDAGGGGRR